MTSYDKVTRRKQDKGLLGLVKANHTVQRAIWDSIEWRGMTEKTATTVTERLTPPLTRAISPVERATSERTNEQDYKSISFSTDFFEQVQSLHDKNVRLKAWIDLCHKVFESCLNSDLSRVAEKAKTQSDALQTKIRAILNEQDSDWGLSHCKSFADVVMANFLRYCWQVRLKRHFERPSGPIAFSKLAQFFDKETLDKFGELMSHDVRIDLWIELCDQAYSCFWNKGKPTILLAEKKKKACEKVNQLVAKDGGKYWPMSRHRLAQFLFSYLPAEPLNGTPKRTASTWGHKRFP